MSALSSVIILILCVGALSDIPPNTTFEDIILPKFCSTQCKNLLSGMNVVTDPYQMANNLSFAVLNNDDFKVTFDTMGNYTKGFTQMQVVNQLGLKLTLDYNQQVKLKYGSQLDAISQGWSNGPCEPCDDDYQFGNSNSVSPYVDLLSWEELDDDLQAELDNKPLIWLPITDYPQFPSDSGRLLQPTSSGNNCPQNSANRYQQSECVRIMLEPMMSRFVQSYNIYTRPLFAANRQLSNSDSQPETSQWTDKTNGFASLNLFHKFRTGLVDTYLSCSAACR